MPLSFGTSGLRGLVKDITDLEAYVNVKGALRYLQQAGELRRGDGVVLAGDLRPSSERILRSCARAVRDAGCDVEHAGRVPTPALMLYGLSTGRASVMVTGSHIPFDRNGIKLSKRAGEVMKSDEPGITAEVERVRREEYGRGRDESPFDASGALRQREELPPLSAAAEEGYLRRYVRAFPEGGLRGLRLLVDQHSAVGRDLLPRILQELGAEVLTGGRSETFVPIDTESITDEQLRRMEALTGTVEESCGPLDAVVSTDGDSDRPLVAAVLREASAGGRRLRFLPGDLLGLVVAEYLGADAAAVPISANDAVARRMRERGATLLRSKIGSPYVLAAMEQLRAAGGHRRIVGWEANGGFLTGSELPLGRGALAALPTRDSTLPILANLFAAAQAGVGLSALWDRLPPRFGRAGLIDGVPVAASRAILARLVPAGDLVEVRFDAAGGVRPGGDAGPGGEGGPALSEETAAAWRERRETLARFFPAALGFDEIVGLNVLDGIRVSFRSGDVAHVRPSGNAPQLRLYATSDSQARADQIVALALAEPDGILRQLERALR